MADPLRSFLGWGWVDPLFFSGYWRQPGTDWPRVLVSGRTALWKKTFPCESYSRAVTRPSKEVSFRATIKLQEVDSIQGFQQAQSAPQ